jgi:patatin-like phospholipase/acyl hydrolase
MASLTTPPPPEHYDRFQILSLDGGGLRGIFMAAVLTAFEDDHAVLITDHFDLIAGTSTGGLIALGLGAGLRPREILDFYLSAGVRVFRSPPLSRVRSLLRPKYDAQRLRKELEAIFGVRTMADSSVPLLIPSFNLDTNTVYMFKTPHHPSLVRDGRVSMVDVAMATTSAPTFFRPHSFEGQSLIDGGVWANNPATEAVAEAVGKFGRELASLRVLSLGSSSDLRLSASHLANGGILSWARRQDIISVLLAGQSHAGFTRLRHLIPNDNIVRIQPIVPPTTFSLDRVDSKQLMGRAYGTSREFSALVADRFLAHRARPLASDM